MRDAMPTWDEFLPVIMKIMSNGEIISRKKLIDSCAKEMSLSENLLNEKLESGEKRLDNRVGWGKSHLKKAGLIEYTSRGNYKITEFGLEQVKRGIDINENYLNTIDSYKEFRSKHRVEGNDEISFHLNPEEQIDNLYKEMNRNLYLSLLEKVRNMEPDKFEQLVIDLLVKMGYAYDKNSAWKTKHSNDEGVDGVVIQDPLSFEIVYTQAKRYAENNLINREMLQKFRGTVAKNHKGIFITTSDFQKNALEFYDSERLDNEHIQLVNGMKLVELMVKYGLGVYDYQSYVVKKIDIDYFEEED